MISFIAFYNMAMDITEQQIRVRPISYKEKNRWAPAYRVRRRAVSYDTACFCNSWKKSVSQEYNLESADKSCIIKLYLI